MPNIINLKKEEKERKADNKSVSLSEPTQEKIKRDIEWTAPEFEYYEKSQNWFIVAGLIAIILFVISIFTKNFLFAFLILISSFLVFTYSFKKPNDVKVKINPKGVKINNILYEFENLKSFWIFYNPPEIKELSLRSKKIIMPYVKIPLGDENPVEIRRFLIKYLPEKKHRESVIDNLSKNFGF